MSAKLAKIFTGAALALTLAACDQQEDTPPPHTLSQEDVQKMSEYGLDFSKAKRRDYPACKDLDGDPVYYMTANRAFFDNYGSRGAIAVPKIKDIPFSVIIYDAESLDILSESSRNLIFGHECGHFAVKKLPIEDPETIEQASDCWGIKKGVEEYGYSEKAIKRFYRDMFALGRDYTEVEGHDPELMQKLQKRKQVGLACYRQLTQQ